MNIKKIIENGDIKHIVKCVEVLLITGLFGMFTWMLLEIRDLPTSYAKISEIRIELEKKANRDTLDEYIKESRRSTENIQYDIKELKSFLMTYFANNTVTIKPNGD